MDPQTTLVAIADALHRNDREQLDEMLDALRRWNRCGGFLPQVERASDPITGETVYRIRSPR